MNGSHAPSLPHRQRGAVLFVALIMLLIITLLAITSMREVTLEARITGNLLEQKRLNATAESVLREGERRVAGNGKSLEACSVVSTPPCITEIASTYTTDFATSSNLSSAGLNGRKARWYVRDTGIISSSDPECFLTGQGCTSYYEVNGQAFNDDSDTGKECGAAALCIRSVTAVIYN